MEPYIWDSKRDSRYLELIVSEMTGDNVHLMGGVFEHDKKKYQIMDKGGVDSLAHRFFKWYVVNRPQWYDSPMECAYQWLYNFDYWKGEYMVSEEVNNDR